MLRTAFQPLGGSSSVPNEEITRRVVNQDVNGAMASDRCVDGRLHLLRLTNITNQRVGVDAAGAERLSSRLDVFGAATSDHHSGTHGPEGTGESKT